MFDPHQNENLYEGHIPEAMLSVNLASGKFSRKRLLESTSMVMSPVDIALPDLQRFPRFARARRVRCSLGPGDVLFMPAFWWHEVQSYPDEEERRNLAVNFWYVHVAYRGVALFTFAMVMESKSIRLWEIGLQDGCHHHGKRATSTIIQWF